jgi:FkbM family methyltransferase
MKFRIADIVKYAIKVNWLNSFWMFLQCKVLNKPVIALHPVTGIAIHLRKNSSDIVAFKQIFIWGEYEYPIKGDIKTIIDGGANIGCASRFFANKFPAAAIISIEPEEGNFKVLQKNTAGNQNITCIRKGLWSKECNLAIDNTGAANWGFRLVETTDTVNSVAAISINALMKQFSMNTIDILKLDVETAEKNIFEYDYEKWLPKTRYLFIETHDFIDKGCSKAVMKALCQYDFSLECVGENLVFINNAFTAS